MAVVVMIAAAAVCAAIKGSTIGMLVLLTLGAVLAVVRDNL